MHVRRGMDVHHGDNDDQYKRHRHQPAAQLLLREAVHRHTPCAHTYRYTPCCSVQCMSHSEIFGPRPDAGRPPAARGGRRARDLRRTRRTDRCGPRCPGRLSECVPLFSPVRLLLGERTRVSNRSEACQDATSIMTAAPAGTYWSEAGARSAELLAQLQDVQHQQRGAISAAATQEITTSTHKVADGAAACWMTRWVPRR